MKKMLKWAAIMAVVALVVGTFVYLYIKSRPQEVVYELNEVQIKDLEKTTIVTGKIEPRDEVNIKPQISGIITELYKEAGEMVKKDEVIAKVKVIPDMGSLSAAENRVRLAVISLNQARTDHQRMKALLDEQVVSQEEYEKTQVALRQAEAEESQARDALNIVRDGVSLSNAKMSTTLIRSTIDGLVLDVPVKVGNSVILSNSFNDGTTIATVADMKNLIFKGNVDETEVGRLHEGMPVIITVGAIENLQMNACIEYISPKGVEQNGANRFDVKAAISLPDSLTLRSGYGANAQIVLQRVKGAVSVPESSLEFSGDSTFVYVLTDSVPKQNFKRTPVVTGLSDGINMEIKGGLKPGQKVRGIQKISDK